MKKQEDKLLEGFSRIALRASVILYSEDPLVSYSWKALGAQDLFKSLKIYSRR